MAGTRGGKTRRGTKEGSRSAARIPGGLPVWDAPDVGSLLSLLEPPAHMRNGAPQPLRGIPRRR